MISIENKLISSPKFHIPFYDNEKTNDSLKVLIEKFNTNITEGIIELMSCPCICGNKTFDLVSSVDRHSIMQKTVICKHCGLIQSNPRYSEEAFKDFIESDFYKLLYFDGNIEKYSHEKYNLSTGMHILKNIEKVKDINEKTRVLEIACAGGWNLLPFVDKKAQVTGADYNNKFVELGKSIGLNLFQTTIHEIEGEFDVIIINKSLNLFFKVKKVFEKIHQLLSDRGVVYVHIKNNERFNYSCLKNININYFTPDSLNFFVSQWGFKQTAGKKLKNKEFYQIFKKSEEKIYFQDFFSKNRKKSYKSIRRIEKRYKMKKFFSRKKRKEIEPKNQFN